MLFMISKYPSFTPECEGGSVQEKNGACIIRMWNKGCKDVKETRRGREGGGIVSM
jgi:hypothetical protein